jgi:uncharacterized membrane protein
MSTLFGLVFDALFLVLNLAQLVVRLAAHSEHDFWFWNNVVLTIWFGVGVVVYARDYLGGSR